MNVREMHMDFKIKVDRLDTLYREDFNSAVIDWLLNEAQNVFVSQRYSSENSYKTKSHNMGFEATQKRMDELSTIHIKYPEQPVIVPNEIDSIYELKLSELKYKYLHLTRLTADVNIDGCLKKDVALKLLQTDDLSSGIRDPFLKESSQIPYSFGRELNGTGAALFMYPFLGVDILGVKVSYLKTPNRVNLGGYEYLDSVVYPPSDCELPEGVHAKIVDIAVDIAAGVIENPQFSQLTSKKIINNE